jgi:MFS family permease
VIVGSVLRGLQGCGEVIIKSSIYSVVVNMYPENEVEFLSYIQSIKGISMLVAPFTGGMLFKVGGYNFLFYFFGTIFLITSLVVKAIFGEETDAINQHDYDNQEGEQDQR